MLLNSILILILAYIIGSFPSGYLITRFSTGKNILELGWRKTSGSNVYRNIGKWQAVLTGLLDIGKGYLAVYLTQVLGFSLQIQILSGVAAVAGHNWSCFLKFAGGRGIGTFWGAAALLFPQIFVPSLILFVILSFTLNSAIATIIFLGVIIFLSVYFNQFTVGGIFTIISLLPIFIKRLSPIKEIFPVKGKGLIIRNRLIFDNDEVRGWKIKEFLKK